MNITCVSSTQRGRDVEDGIIKYIHEKGISSFSEASFMEKECVLFPIMVLSKLAG